MFHELEILPKSVSNLSYEQMFERKIWSIILWNIPSLILVR